jgi:hypothetical protein
VPQLHCLRSRRKEIRPRRSIDGQTQPRSCTHWVAAPRRSRRQKGRWPYSLRGNLLEEASNFGDAEREYLLSVKLEPNGTTWSRLGAIYNRQDRLVEEIDAWEHASELLPYPAIVLLPLGYASLLRTGRKWLCKHLTGRSPDCRRLAATLCWRMWHTDAPQLGTRWEICNAQPRSQKRQ